MDTVSIWRFDTSDAAEVALGVLDRLQTRRLVTVDDVAVVVWPSGRLRPHGYQVGAIGATALSGAFWGLLFGLLFLLPLAGVGNEPGRAVLARVGLADDFLADVRGRVTAGTSALFLVTDGAAVDRIRDAFAGAELLVSSLDREQQAALRRAFDADAALTPPEARRGS